MPPNTSQRKSAVEQEQINTVVNHRDYPAPLSQIADDAYSVVVVGAGPAGLMISSSLARLGGGNGAQHSVLTVDIRTQPTEAGRADGIQPRTIEVLKNMQPLGNDLFSRSSASYERTFWNPTKDGKGIERSRRTQSVPSHLEIEDNCTLGLQQGLIEQGFLRDMEAHNAFVVRPWSFKSFELKPEDTEYPVHVTLQHAKEQATRIVRTKYLVGADGGRSSVRQFLEKNHGIEFKGEWVDTLWGAIDAVVKSDFPDLRKIAAIHSKEHGAMYIFPRENSASGKPLVRLYTQINIHDGKKDKNPAYLARDSVKAADIMAADQRIIAPFKLEFEDVEWWTAYPIGQRLVSSYSLNNRVFLAGDACHTHSPKAGQGMNTALMDAHNLSYKIHLVLSGVARPDLLSTYHTERWKIGKKLIDFDEEYSALFSGEIPRGQPELAKLSEAALADHFTEVQRRNAAFTTGIGVVYEDEPLTYTNEKLPKLGLEPMRGVKLLAGHRLTPARVTRCSNLAPVRLVHEVQFTAPGGFRIYIFAGGAVAPSSSTSPAAVASTRAKLAAFSHYLSSDPRSFVRRFGTKLSPRSNRVIPEALNTSIIGYEELNPWFAILTVVRDSRFHFNLEDLKDLPGLNSMIYADDEEAGGERIGDEDGDASVGGAHEKYGLEEGGIVVCRPDGYVGVVVPLEEKGWAALERYFNGFLQISSHVSRL